MAGWRRPDRRSGTRGVRGLGWRGGGGGGGAGARREVGEGAAPARVRTRTSTAVPLGDPRAAR